MKRNECIIFKSKRSYQTPNFNHLTFDATFSKIKPNREVNILRMQTQNTSLVSSLMPTNIKFKAHADLRKRLRHTCGGQQHNFSCNLIAQYT